MTNSSDNKLKEEFKNFMQSDAYKTQVELKKEKMKTVKSGSDVVHLEYIGELNSIELAEVESELSRAGLRLSSFDKSGIMYASMDQFTLTSYLVISSTVLNELLSGVATNAVWDAIKWTAVTIWSKVKDRTYNKLQSGKIEAKQITFGLKVNLDNNTGINIQLAGDVDERLITESLDKVLDFLREQKLNDSYKIDDFAYYQKDKGQWKRVDVMSEFQKLSNERSTPPRAKTKKRNKNGNDK